MFPVQCEELRINHLTLLLIVTTPYACWFLWRAEIIHDFKWHFQFGVAFWRVVFWEVYCEGPNCVWRALKTSSLNIGSTEWIPWGFLWCLSRFQVYLRNFWCHNLHSRLPYGLVILHLLALWNWNVYLVKMVVGNMANKVNDTSLTIINPPYICNFFSFFVLYI